MEVLQGNLVIVGRCVVSVIREEELIIIGSLEREGAEA